MTNKELQEWLRQYPENALVTVEYCNINEIRYNDETNIINID